MKSPIKFIILILLTWFNLKYYPILLVFPLPYFGFILGFILSSIWVYLFLYFGVSLIFRIFNINKPIKKTYLAFIFPVFMGLWFGVSFIPLEYQPSFRKFEKLCKNHAGVVIYDEKFYKLWDGWDGKKEFGEVIRHEETKKINWRIFEGTISYNFIDHQGKESKIMRIKGFDLKIIGMLNEESINCGYFKKSKDQK